MCFRRAQLLDKSEDIKDDSPYISESEIIDDRDIDEADLEIIDGLNGDERFYNPNFSNPSKGDVLWWWWAAEIVKTDKVYKCIISFIVEQSE